MAALELVVLDDVIFVTLVESEVDEDCIVFDETLELCQLEYIYSTESFKGTQEADKST